MYTGVLSFTVEGEDVGQALKNAEAKVLGDKLGNLSELKHGFVTEVGSVGVKDFYPGAGI